MFNQTKILTIAVIASIIALYPALISTPIQEADASAYCQGHTNQSVNWRDGCESGLADCRGQKDYNFGKGHTQDFINGYNAGWSNGGCYIP